MYDWQKQELLDMLRELMELADDYNAEQNITERLEEANEALESVEPEIDYDDS
jgi:hypothetical protein